MARCYLFAGTPGILRRNRRRTPAKEIDRFIIETPEDLGAPPPLKLRVRAAKDGTLEEIVVTDLSLKRDTEELATVMRGIRSDLGLGEHLPVTIDSDVHLRCGHLLPVLEIVGRAMDGRMFACFTRGLKSFQLLFRGTCFRFLGISFATAGGNWTAGGWPRIKGRA